MDLQHCRIQRWPNKWACIKICIDSLPGCVKEIVEDSHRPAPTFRLTTPPSHNLIHAIHPSWKNCQFRRYSVYNEGGGAVRGDRFPCCVAWPPLAHTVTERPVLFVNSTGYFLRKESVIKNIPVFKVITWSKLCLFTALWFSGWSCEWGGLRQWVCIFIF